MATTASFYDDLVYGEQNPVLKAILKIEHSKEVRICFRKGQELKKHKAPHPIVVQVLEGKIDFGLEDSERFILEKGMMIALDANLFHDLVAEEDSIVRLSINTKSV
ncbi:cupin domain-containing protein [Vaginella massiliensis]|uniref:cupin domain-containing protein n=1 Tax=Vaginella massiliensis TaxID=1816680 RepID=UPI000838B12B|nr:cupin domain-containing protein [Vaginella massiliensis]